MVINYCYSVGVDDENKEGEREFDFLIDERLVRGSLESHITEHGIPTVSLHSHSQRMQYRCLVPNDT